VGNNWSAVLNLQFMFQKKLLVDASSTAAELYPGVFQAFAVGYNHSRRFKTPKSITAFDVPTMQKCKNCQISALLSSLSPYFPHFCW
jgi:hypothetical protein